MLALALVLAPLLAAALALVLPSNRWRPLLLPLAGSAHLALALLALARPELYAGNGWLDLDPLAKPFLLSLSVLFFCCSFYAVGYLRYRGERNNRVFTACMAGFLGVISVVIQAQHLGLLWISVEATTLITAPLIYFNRTKRSIEATWKYLLVCSVGIALALMGTFLLAYSALRGGLQASLSWSELIGVSSRLSRPWLRAAFVLLLAGYGTKMGLAPFHFWKPDAYGESPGVVGALFSGGVTSAAFLALLRAHAVCAAAGTGAFDQAILLAVGLLSMAVAGIFLVGQRDLKRALTYSSVENMGILAFGLGLGPGALWAVLLHAVNNALSKGALFLSAGNLHRAFGSRTTDRVRGALRLVPFSASLFLALFLAISGSPPFGPFLSEFGILRAAADVGAWVPAVLYLALLLLVFIGLGSTVLTACFGRVPPRTELQPAPAVPGARPELRREGFLTVAPVFLLAALVLLLGIWIPGPFGALLSDAAASIGGAQ